MPRRLTLVLHSLGTGGSERVLSMMANYWASQGDAVTVITLGAVERDDYALVPQVTRVGLGLMHDSRGVIGALLGNLRRIRTLRRAIQVSRPEHVISFTEKMNVVTLLACCGIPFPVVISERVDPRKHAVGRIWSLLRRRVYPRCHALVVQTSAVRDFMRGIVSGKPIYVIPNAAPQPKNGSTAEPARTGRRTVVAMGRLVSQKGFDLLIDAFSRIAQRHPGWDLLILGKGPAQPELEAQIATSGLQARITLCGWTPDPFRLLQAADLFVLSSRYEGFPNALLEAMSAGLPAISFDCQSGPAEIIRHEIDGLLVLADSVDGLSSALDRLMSNEPERRRLGLRATEVRERFSSERYFREWDAVLQGVTEQEFLHNVRHHGFH